MALTEEQAGVLWRMFFGMAISVAIIASGSFLNPFDFDSSHNLIDRLALAIQCLLLPLVFLVVAVGRVAKHRFFTSEDIDGGGASDDTQRAKSLQSVLQNTLEQFCIASSAYLTWAVVMPGQTLAVIPLAAAAFSIGRILFFVGYSAGARSRALGFTLTFYPSVAMLICMLGFWLLQWATPM